MANNEKVFLVGAGPGDPMLITLKGLECMQNSDVIIYDRLINKSILSYAKKDAELIYCGKRPKAHSMKQDEINRLMIRKSREGKTVTRLKGGDPFIFGRGGEEAMALAKEKIPFEIVPGVSSAIAVPTYAGVPLTHRGYASSVAFITGHRKQGSATNIITKEIANFPGTLVILMVMENIHSLFEELIKQGKKPNTPVAVIESGTTSQQKTLIGTLEEIEEKIKQNGFTSPAVIVVGDVVNLRESLKWYERKPLFGKKILVTSPEVQASRMADYLSALGAEVIKFPAIKITPVDNYDKIDKAIKRIERYHWIIFTSQNGVDFFMERFAKSGRDIRDLKGIRFATIGKRTSEKLREYKINTDFVPREYTSEALVKGLKRYKVRGKNFLITKSKKVRDIISNELKKIGAKVYEMPLYKIEEKKENIKKVEPLLKHNEIDGIIFTSPSGVKSFFNRLKSKKLRNCIKNTKIISIGPVTARAIESFGIQNDIIPEEYTVKAIVEAIERYFKNKKSNIKM